MLAGNLDLTGLENLLGLSELGFTRFQRIMKDN